MLFKGVYLFYFEKTYLGNFRAAFRLFIKGGGGGWGLGLMCLSKFVICTLAVRCQELEVKKKETVTETVT